MQLRKEINICFDCGGFYKVFMPLDCPYNMEDVCDFCTLYQSAGMVVSKEFLLNRIYINKNYHTTLFG